MKHRISVSVTLLILLTISCVHNTEKRNVPSDPLESEVIAIYNEAIDQVGIKIRLKNQLRRSTDSTRQEEHTMAIKRLDDAHKGMMMWMQNFLTQFPDATLKGHGYHHHDEVGPFEGNNKLSEEDKREYLLIEKQKIMELDEKMSNAIFHAKYILNQ
ncbi:hypothetical protein FNH22_11145 [Fulvivirga sp. M361]|uniref:hypothetical protein n=1 Tax=Fulvivirga sp. M361 TaxID=2594266 RepID=UPI00117AED4A|nr:hypothetical protein [Fulvivirga sp. M361]TRX59076.1 hypothetical protein FNH22_11145 [Fulvivirga sp. M361]